MPYVIDRIETDKLSVGGLQIQKPKDPREYILSKENFEEVTYSLDRGEFILNNEYFTFPNDTLYVLSSIETYLKFQEGQVLINPTLIESKKINVSSSVETFLKFWEATNGNVSYNYNSKTGFQEQFLKLINDPAYFDETNLQNKAELIDRILDKGIVEFGEIGEGSKIVYTEILKKTILTVEQARLRMQNGNLDNTTLLRELFDIIIDKGIVVRTYKTNLIISSVEKYLQFLESESNNGGGEVPA